MTHWVVIFISLISFSANVEASRFERLKPGLRACMIKFGLASGRSRWAYSQKFAGLELEAGEVIPSKLLRWDNEIAERNPNGVFIENIRNPKVKTVFTVENILVKELNQKIDKDIVTATVNHYKQIFLKVLQEENIKAHGHFKNNRKLLQSKTISHRDIIGVYNDFKSFRILLGRRDRDLTKLLGKVTEIANARYAREVRRQSWFKKALKSGKLKGLAQDPRRWQLAGTGRTLEEADLASRFGRLFTTGSVSVKISRRDILRHKVDPDLYRVALKRVEKGDERGAGFGKVFFDFSNHESVILFHLKNTSVTRRLLQQRLPEATPSGLKILEHFPEAGNRMMLSKDAIEVLRSVTVDPRFGKNLPGRKRYLDALGKALENHFGKGSFHKGGNSETYYTNLRLIKEYFDEINMYPPGLLNEKRVRIELSGAQGNILAVDFRGAGVYNLYETQKAMVLAEVKMARVKDYRKESGILSEFLFDTRKGEAKVTRFLDKLKDEYTKEVLDAKLPVSGNKFTGDDGFSLGKEKFSNAQIERYMEEVAGSKHGNLFRNTLIDLNYKDTGRVLSEVDRHRYIFFGEEIEKALRKKLKGKTFDTRDLSHLFFGVHIIPNQKGGGKVRLIVGSNLSSARAKARLSISALHFVVTRILEGTHWDQSSFRGFKIETISVP